MNRRLRAALLAAAVVLIGAPLSWAAAGGQATAKPNPASTGCATQFDVVSLSGDTSTVGQRATFQVTATCGGKPLAGWYLMFDVRSQGGGNPNVFVNPEGETNASGVARMTYTRSAPGVDAISAFNPINRGAGALANLVRHTWVAPPPPPPPPPPPELRVTLSPAGTTGRVGTQFTVSADVMSGDEGADDPAVVFTRRMLGAPDETLRIIGSSSGHAEWTYTRNVPGVEIISATATLNETRAEAAPIRRVWEDPSPPPGPGPSDPETSGPGSPGPGSPGPNSPGPESPGPGPSGPGSPSGSDSPSGPGSPSDPDSPTDEPTDFPSETPSDQPSELPTASPGSTPTDAPTEPPSEPSATPDGIRLSPDGTSTFVSEDFTSVAKVVDADGEPVEGARVAFVARMPGSARVERRVVTDERGRAELLYTRLQPGKERIRATVGTGRSALAASIGHTWQPPVEDAVTCQQATDTSVTSTGEIAFLCGGCPTDAAVAMAVDGTPLTVTTESVTEGAEVVGTLPGLEPGTHSAMVSCGGRDAIVSVPVVGETTSSAAVGGSAGTAGAVLVFFVLIGWLLLPRGLRSPGFLAS